MANLYELTADIQLLWNLMDQGELDDDMIMDAMQNSQEELAIKLEGYCKWIRNMEADVAALKEEEKRLAARRKTLEHTIERAKSSMHYAMNEAGEKKIKGNLFTISVQNNPPKVVMDKDIDDIPERYIKYLDPEIDKAKIKEDIQKGIDVEGIAHLEQTESLRIR